MRKVSYNEVSLQLDKLMFEGDLSTDQKAQERADIIDAYLEAVNWSWDQVLAELSKEDQPLVFN